MGSSALSWAVGIYMLAVAAFVVLGGRLGDLLGERVAFGIGLATFAIEALLVATAQGELMVILGRLVQGLGSATLMPATMAMLRIAFRPSGRATRWASGRDGGVAFALGPLIGGVLTDEASWRWVWWGLADLRGGPRVVGARPLRGMPRPSERPRVDYLGVALLALCLFSLILALQEGPDWGWASGQASPPSPSRWRPRRRWSRSSCASMSRCCTCGCTRRRCSAPLSARSPVRCS